MRKSPDLPTFPVPVDGTRTARLRVTRSVPSVTPLLPRPVARTSPRDQMPDAAVLVSAADLGVADGTPDPPLPRLLGAAEVAVVFGRSARTIHEWVRRGLLAPVPMGRSLFFPEPDIRALLADRLARRLQRR